MYNFNCLCMSYEFDLQQKQTTKGKIDFLSTIKRSYCPLSPIPQQFFLRYYPWLIWPRWVCAADLGW